MNNPENPSPYNLGRGARLNLTHEILLELSEVERGLDQIVGARFKHLGEHLQRRDRRDIENRLRSIMLHYARLVWWIKRVKLEPNMRLMVLCDLVFQERVDLDQLLTLCNGAKNRMEALRKNEIAGLKKMMGQKVTHPDMPIAVQQECPDWAWPGLEKRFGDQLDAALKALTSKARTDLRVNTLKANVETAQAQLAQQGIKTQKGHLSPLSLRLEQGGGPQVSETNAFRDGLVEVQDEGSQIVAQLVDAHKGMQVVDFCAGAGGKTLALAAQMENGGHIVAADVHSKRLQRARVRLKRAGVENTERHVLSLPHDKWLKKNKSKYDRVLIDAPCSGTGTWRRNPESKWNRDHTDLQELCQLQRDIMERAAMLVKPGGRLIYATCSLLPEENEDQVAQFLATHAEFSALPLAEVAPSLETSDPHHLVLSPLVHECDGFFCAILSKSSV